MSWKIDLYLYDILIYHGMLRMTLEVGINLCRCSKLVKVYCTYSNVLLLSLHRTFAYFVHVCLQKVYFIWVHLTRRCLPFSRLDPRPSHEESPPRHVQPLWTGLTLWGRGSQHQQMFREYVEQTLYSAVSGTTTELSDANFWSSSGKTLNGINFVQNTRISTNFNEFKYLYFMYLLYWIKSIL